MSQQLENNNRFYFYSAFIFQGVCQLQVQCPVDRISTADRSEPTIETIFTRGRLVTNITQIAPGSLLYVNELPPVPLVVLEINGDDITVGDVYRATRTLNFHEHNLIDVTLFSSFISILEL